MIRRWLTTIASRFRNKWGDQIAMRIAADTTFVCPLALRDFYECRRSNKWRAPFDPNIYYKLQEQYEQKIQRIYCLEYVLKMNGVVEEESTCKFKGLHLPCNMCDKKRW